MKIALSILILFMVNGMLAQTQNSDLRIRIDSIIKYQIGYKIDSTTNALPIKKWDSTKQRGLYPSFSSLSANPMTLIILDTQKINLNDLNKYNLSEVEIVKVYFKNNQSLSKLYGTAAKNGLIILKTKE